MSRFKNTQRNIVTAMATNGIEIFLAFLVRTIILYVLGSDYVGLSGLFTSILQVLNVAELGFSSAIVYNMYKPIAEGDDATICALLKVYRKVYKIVGSIILFAGSGVMFFLPKLIKSSWPSDINIYILYLIYLIDASISYLLFAYKESLIIANQRLDVMKVVRIGCHTIKYILQIVVLVVSKNYHLFALVSILGTVLNSIVVQMYTKKYYPQYTCKGKLSEDSVNGVKKQVGGLMLSKLSGISRNSFDSIILSSLIGLTMVAVYGNYYFILTGVYTIINYITQSMQASIGDSLVVFDKGKNYKDLRTFQFLYGFLVNVATICMLCGYQPIMRLWTGEELMLKTGDMLLFCLYFFIMNLTGIIDIYFVGRGLWWRAKYAYILEAGCNLLLNILLGNIWGVTGVLIATNVTMLAFRFIPVLTVTFKYYFENGLKRYLIDVFEMTACAAVAGAVGLKLTSVFRIENKIINVIVCLVVGGAISTVVSLVALSKTQAFGLAKNFVMDHLKGKKTDE